MNSLFKFLIAVFAVFRLTELFTRDEGPYQMFSKLRIWSLQNAHKSETRQTIADGLHCPYCLSVWLSFIILLVPDKLKYIFGIAGAVSLIETFTKEK